MLSLLFAHYYYVSLIYMEIWVDDNLIFHCKAKNRNVLFSVELLATVPVIPLALVSHNLQNSCTFIQNLM